MSWTDLAKLDVTVRPLDNWPGAPTPTDQRQTSRFEAPLRSTVALLARELDMLAAQHGVLQLDLRDSQLRIDGLPRADARAGAPGVILAFDSKHGPLRYACDRFVKSPWKRESGEDWQHNLRSIALTLESLRAVDRYGATKDGQQYRGYAQLPAGIAAPPTHMTTDEAARFIVETAIPVRWAHADVDEAGIQRAARAITSDPGYRKEVCRDATKAAHPDVAGGSDALFQQLQAAKALLEREYGRG